MGWEDRSYYRDGRQANDPISMVLNGSLPLFTFSGIRVRVHATLLIFIASVLLLGLGKNFDFQARVESMAVLFGIVLLHEFGHCFAARSVGGNAEEVMMTPLGGLAFAYAPRKPYPQFITVAGGPAVNVVICVICATVLYSTGGGVNLHPFHPWFDPGRWPSIGMHVGWVFVVSYLLLLFNLLPIFPLDGGQMLQAALWPKMGYYRSMNLACLVGLPASIAIAVFALATQQWLLLFIMLWTAYTCFSVRRQLQAMGPVDFAAEDEPDYSASIYATETAPKKQHKRLSRRKIRRLRMQAQREAAEQARIDAILAKVSAHGMHSLTWLEKRALRQATERQRKHDLELTRGK